MSLINVNTKNISDELKKLVAEQQKNNALQEALVMNSKSIADSLVTVVEILQTPPTNEEPPVITQEYVDELADRLRRANDKLAADVQSNTNQ